MTNHPALGALRQQVEREYRRRTPRSRALQAQAESYLPAGDTRHGTHFLPYPSYIESGQGSYLVDVDGNQLLDFTLNSTSLIHGHAHPTVVEAIRRQAARGTAWNAPNESLLQLAGLLSSRIPSIELVRFCNSGTEANMQAQNAARAFTGRNTILKMTGAYHGTYEPHNVVHAAFNERESTADLIRARRGDLAAVVVNPILTRPALTLPEPGYLEFLRHVTRDNGVLLIFDEVISLRVAYGGAQDWYAVTPDLTAMGKIIGGGLPVGAFGGRADIMRVFADGEPPTVSHAGTFNGNPLTAAAGLAAMQLLGTESYESLATRGQRLDAALREVLEESGVALEVTSARSLVSLELPAAQRTPAHTELLRLVQLALLTRGVKTSGLLAVSTVTTEAEIDRLARTLADVLNEFQSAIEIATPDLVRAAPQRV